MKRGIPEKKPQVYPPRYIEDFLVKRDEVAARIPVPAVEDAFETGAI